MPFQKGVSGNPKGKPKGAISGCTKTKNDYFKVYEKMGGYNGFLKFIKENRQLWPEFFFKVLPGLMPKKTELEGKIGVSGPLRIEIVGREKKDDQG